MKQLSNYHTHTKYCNHAGGVPEDYAKEAISLGFKTLGISDHAPLPLPLKQDNSYKMRNMYIEEFEELYLKDFYYAKEKYKDKLNMYVGVETEYIEEYHSHYEYLRSKLDYMILGIHFIIKDNKMISTYGDINYNTIYDYANICIKALDTKLYDYLGHPDLFFIQYKDKNGNLIWDENCDKVSRMIIEACIKNDVYLEINANGPNNSKRFGYSQDFNWLYPNYNFWKIVSEYKEAKIIVGSDAHNPKSLVTEYTPKIYEFIDKLNLNVITYLKNYK